MQKLFTEERSAPRGPGMDRVRENIWSVSTNVDIEAAETASSRPSVCYVAWSGAVEKDPPIWGRGDLQSIGEQKQTKLQRVVGGGGVYL